MTKNEYLREQLNEQWKENDKEDFELYKNVKPDHNQVKNHKPQYINVPDYRRKSKN